MAEPRRLVADVHTRRGLLELEAQFAVSPGQPLAVLGSNGAGKTSLLRVLAGHEALTAGSIRLGERVIDDPASDVFVPADQRRIGVVFQDYRLFGWMSVQSNIGFALRARPGSRRDHRTARDEILGRFDLEGIAQRRSDTLSGGQAQRLAIARALASQPEALLLDEPFAALDRSAGALLRELLDELINSFEGPVVIVTHSSKDALRFASHAIALESGKVVSTGTVADVIESTSG